MSHYKSNVRDQVFNLFEVLGLDQAFGEGDYADLDIETAQEMLGEMVRLAEGPIAESFVDGDRNPPVFDPATHSVTLPESFKKSVRAHLEGGWDRVGVIEELGGIPMPKVLMWALQEHILGANPAVWMYGGGAGVGNIFHNIPPRGQEKGALLGAGRGWGSALVLGSRRAARSSRGAAPAPPTSSTTPPPKSRRSGPSSPPSAAGVRPWC